MLLPPRSRGRPPKTERPHRVTEHPINHHVADPEPPWIADRDKAGRPRAPFTTSTRTRATPSSGLTLRTSTDKELRKQRRPSTRESRLAARAGRLAPLVARRPQPTAQ